RSDIARVAPGQFQTSADGRRVFFIDSHSDGQHSARNVFMVMTNAQQEAVITAKDGLLENKAGLRYLVLKHGERTQTALDTGAKTLSRFETADILVGEAPDPTRLEPDVRSLSTPALLMLGHRQAGSELVWRFGLIWAAVNMVLAGLSLAAGNARRNSNWNLIYALLVFVVYFNLLSLSQSWVAKGRIDWIPCLALLHGGLTLGTLLVIWWRDGAVWPGQGVRRVAAPPHSGGVA
ncbi:MAG TPA: LptF/LptG family permease, partial [Aquabacterium sp.]|nr:LptF/LptG family permease [Aquabacterium sp.]